ncbi:MAG TPA: ATP-binding cassette domain-containing protein [Tepidisphaeraceae bacterium]|nr:ATP-binding cassette domain-containing protein [Tepidisphaeraceae bacterium]
MQQPGIHLKKVGVRRGERWILHDINWSVPAGSCAAILGPNGSGKSTLARVLAGYIWPTVGEVAIDGHRFGETDLNDLRHSIRLVQPAGPYDVDAELTAQQVVLTGLFGTIGLFNEPPKKEFQHARDLLAKVGLSNVIDHHYATLSSGERIRALIARALIRKPRLLLLDEPTAGLDLLAREQVLATVQSLIDDAATSPTIVLITHHVEELGPLTADVLLLAEGQIAARGSLPQVLTSEILSKAYRCPLYVEMRGARYYVRVDSGAWKSLLGE